MPLLRWLAVGSAGVALLASCVDSTDDSLAPDGRGGHEPADLRHAAGGSDGGISVTPPPDASGPTLCPIVGPPTDPADSLNLQAMCEPSWNNPPGCPDKPIPAGPCSLPGAHCAYPTGDSFLLDACNKTWSETVHFCKETCDAPDSGVHLVPLADCGSSPEIECRWGRTNQEDLDDAVRQIGGCCSASSEADLEVFFTDGCATAVVATRVDADCVAQLLAGRRLSCAKDLACAEAHWSTVM